MNETARLGRTAFSPLTIFIFFSVDLAKKSKLAIGHSAQGPRAGATF